MKYLKGNRVKIIDKTENGFDMQTIYNSFVAKLEEDGCKYTDEFQPSIGFIIRYEVTKAIPETTKDEYELKGMKFHCIECPFYQRPTDGRVRYTHCGFSNSLCRADDYACDQFYEFLDSGTITPIKFGEEIER